MDYKEKLEKATEDIKLLEVNLADLKRYVDVNVEEFKKSIKINSDYVKNIIKDVEKHFIMLSDHITGDQVPWQESLKKFGEVFNDVNMLESNFKSLKTEFGVLQGQLETVKTHLQKSSEHQILTTASIGQISKVVEKIDKRLCDEVKTRIDNEEKARTELKTQKEKTAHEKKVDFRWKVGTILTLCIFIVSSLITGLYTLGRILETRDMAQTNAIEKLSDKTEQEIKEIRADMNKNQDKFYQEIKEIFKGSK
jgi:hypothetical protein